jgi:hypothetical protein
LREIFSCPIFHVAAAVSAATLRPDLRLRTSDLWLPLLDRRGRFPELGNLSIQAVRTLVERTIRELRQCVAYPADASRRVSSELMLPNSKNAPAKAAKNFIHLPIPSFISLQF